MNEQIKVLIVNPMMPSMRIEIDNALETFQSIVGDDIKETVLSDGLIVLSDKDGENKNLNYCCTIDGNNFLGTIIIASYDEQNENHVNELRDSSCAILQYGTRIQR